MFADLSALPVFSLSLVLLPCKDAGEAAAQEGCFAFCKSFIPCSPSQSTSSVLDAGTQGERNVCLGAQHGRWVNGLQLALHIPPVGGSTSTDAKILGEKNSRKFQKANYVTWHLHCIYNYFPGIYTVFGIVSNLEMS